MYGNAWMFSDQIDDEDLAFMEHDFITYRMACEYYGLGLKPVTRLSHEAGAVYKVGKKGAEKYSLSLTKFQELAREAGATYKIDKVVLVNCEIFEKYLETFREG